MVRNAVRTFCGKCVRTSDTRRSSVKPSIFVAEDLQGVSSCVIGTLARGH